MLGMLWLARRWPRLRTKPGPFQASSSAPMTTWTTARAGASDTASQAGGSAGEVAFTYPAKDTSPTLTIQGALLEHLETPSGCGLIVSSSSFPHRCDSGNLNGHYYNGPYQAMTDDGVVWYTWHGWWYSIKSVVMMVRADDLKHPVETSTDSSGRVSPWWCSKHWLYVFLFKKTTTKKPFLLSQTSCVEI